MNILIWRHAEASDSTPEKDLQRPLTRKGQKQAKLVAGWLKNNLEANTKILVSPALRAQQTAQALSQHFATVEEIAPGCEVNDLATLIRAHKKCSTLLIVGHQPSLGQLACKLLTGIEVNLSIRKSAVWWFTTATQEGFPQTTLRIVISPEFLKKKLKL